MKIIENNYYIAKHSNIEYVIDYIIYVNEFKDEYTTISLHDGKELIIHKNLHKNVLVNSRLRPVYRQLTPLEIVLYHFDINKIEKRFHEMNCV